MQYCCVLCSLNYKSTLELLFHSSPQSKSCMIRPGTTCTVNAVRLSRTAPSGYQVYRDDPARFMQNVAWQDHKLVLWVPQQLTSCS